MQEVDGSWTGTVEYCKFNYALAQITAGVPDVEFLLEQIDTIPGTYYTAICKQVLLALYQLTRAARSGSFSLG